MSATVVRLALQYGINAMDTSPYYHPSEITLGKILHTLKPEYPRESYYLISKVGRYGPNRSDFDYSPERVEKSVMLSLERLGTDYLDAALLHDIEFLSGGSKELNQEGFYAQEALAHEEDVSAEANKSIDDVDDERILKAIWKLFELKEKGLVRNVGISGYPVPILLRLSRLVASNPPYKPLDIILSYSNHNLHCDLLLGYRENRFAAKPRGSSKDWVAPRLINASPFSMGLLRDSDPPPWHPAKKELKEACKEVSKTLISQGSSLAQTALQYGIRGSEMRQSDATRPILSTIAGLSTVDDVHQFIQAYRIMLTGAHMQSLPPLSPPHRFASSSSSSSVVPLCTLPPLQRNRLQKEYQKQQKNEEYVIAYMKERNLYNWCWASPPEGADK
jgi:D-arabinose 1-dehydrogenase